MFFKQIFHWTNLEVRKSFVFDQAFVWWCWQQYLRTQNVFGVERRYFWSLPHCCSHHILIQSKIFQLWISWSCFDQYFAVLCNTLQYFSVLYKLVAHPWGANQGLMLLLNLTKFLTNLLSFADCHRNCQRCESMRPIYIHTTASWLGGGILVRANKYCLY